MTRVTNFVARKRKYISDPVPQYSPEPDTVNGPWPKRRRDGGRQDTFGPRKAKDQADRRRPQAGNQRARMTICFACREQGHTAKNCPSALSVEDGKKIVGICYRCGSNEHILKTCRRKPDPQDPLPFASCFVCSGQGHIAGQCPKNEKGFYPNGGGCRLCGMTDHLVKDCPMRSAAATSNTLIGLPASSQQEVGADEDDFHAFKRVSRQLSSEEKGERRKSEILERQRAAAKVNPPSSTSSVLPRSSVPTRKKAKVVAF